MLLRHNRIPQIGLIMSVVACTRGEVSEEMIHSNSHPYGVSDLTQNYD